jgi:uncharacterized protein
MLFTEPQMLDNAAESHILQDTYLEVQRRFAHVNDPAHGWEHVRRVYQLALHIAKQEGADPFIAGMAALMHDLGRVVAGEAEGREGDLSGGELKAVSALTMHHADLSVIAANEILAAFQVSSERQEAILHAISAHSFSRNIEPRTLEACVVRDADRLDGLGAIGVVRWAITGTIRRTPQTKTYNPDDPFAERHTPDDQLYMLDHFYTKLLKLSDTMTTETGRRLAKDRTNFMRAFLDELRQELDDRLFPSGH